MGRQFASLFAFCPNKAWHTDDFLPGLSVFVHRRWLAQRPELFMFAVKNDCRVALRPGSETVENSPAAC